MKKLKENKLTLIIILAMIILIIVGVVLFFTSNPTGKKILNNYNFKDETVELDGTNVYKNENLYSKHCLNGICINEATFYYNDKEGRVEYTITNTSNEVKSGYMRMIFGSQSLVIVYKDLAPNKTINSRSQYEGVDIKDKSDYKLLEFTEEEISKMPK